MGTIEDKLTKLADTKEEIKNAIVEKGQTISDSDTFASYAKKILAIQTGVQLPELSNPATETQVLSGYEFIDEVGDKKTGTIATKTANNLTASGATVTVPAGYYASQATKSVPTTTQATPNISISSSGLITASATQTEGYVAADTKSATKQLTTQAVKTITPTTSDQTAVASGVYTTGAVTVAGDSNLVAANIKSGITIFGVTGTYVPVFV